MMEEKIVRYKKRIFLTTFMLPMSLFLLLFGFAMLEENQLFMGSLSLLLGLVCLCSVPLLIRRLFLPYAIRYNDQEIEFLTVAFKGKKTTKIKNEVVKNHYYSSTNNKGNEMNNFNFFMTHEDKEKLGFKLTKKEICEQADGALYANVAIAIPDLKREEKQAFLAFLDKKFSPEPAEEALWTSGIE